MIDDSLDDVCSKDQTMKTEKEVMDEKRRLNKLYEVDKANVYEKEIWNEAIEAALKIALDHSDYAAYEIRKLKK